MKEIIQKKLEEIEKQEHVKIILAVAIRAKKTWINSLSLNSKIVRSKQKNARICLS